MSVNPLNRLYTEAAHRKSAPQFDLQAYMPLSKNTFKVVAAVYDVPDEAAFAEQVASVTDGAGRLVPGSFNMKGRIAVGVVAANARSKPLDASFTPLTAASAADPAGTIWRVEADGPNKRVVLESSDDLPAIFNDRMNRRAVHANPVEGAAIATASFKNGALVRYVDVATAKTQWGIAFKADTGVTVITCTAAGKAPIPVTIERDAVIAAVPRNQLPAEVAGTVDQFEENAKLSAEKLNGIIAYLSKAYGPASGPMLDRLRKLAANSH